MTEASAFVPMANVRIARMRVHQCLVALKMLMRRARRIRRSASVWVMFIVSI